MSMFYASEGIAKVWDNFLQSNAQGGNSSFHSKDYYVVCAISPYFMLHHTKLSAWFITWPGTAGKDNPSGMSRLITGTPLRLEVITICTHTGVLGIPCLSLCPWTPLPLSRWLYLYYTKPHVFTHETIPCAEDPASTIVAIPDYHTTEAGQFLTI